MANCNVSVMLKSTLVFVLLLQMSKEADSQTPRPLDAKIDMVVMIAAVTSGNPHNIMNAANRLAELFPMGDDKTRIGVTDGPIISNFTTDPTEYANAINKSVVEWGIMEGIQSAIEVFQYGGDRGPKIFVLFHGHGKILDFEVPKRLREMGAAIYVVTIPDAAHPRQYEHALNATGGDPTKVFNSSDSDFADLVSITENNVFNAIRRGLCSWKVLCIYGDAQTSCDPDVSLPFHWVDEGHRETHCEPEWRKPTRSCTNGEYRYSGDCWEECNRQWPWDGPLPDCKTTTQCGRPEKVKRNGTRPPKMGNCPTKVVCECCPKYVCECPSTAGETTAGPNRTRTLEPRQKQLDPNQKEQLGSDAGRQDSSTPWGLIIGVVVAAVMAVVVVIAIGIVIVERRRRVKKATPSGKKPSMKSVVMK